MKPNEWIRYPAVAGSFYPANPIQLMERLKAQCPEREKTSAIAIMAPHAGYVYSGKIAGEVYSRTRIPSTVIVICPNHTGLSGAKSRVSIWGKGSWITPLGETRVDEAFAGELLQKLKEKPDALAHRQEHANEVHLPFLQFLNPSVKIVPITLGHLSWERCSRFATALSEVAKNRDVLIVASTDMSHFLSAAESQTRDALALKEVEGLDGESLYRAVVENDISMCGFIPTAVALKFAQQLGAKRSKILAYGHSGEVSGNHRRVVGYAAASFS